MQPEDILTDWLPAHDERVKREAWGEGYRTCDRVWTETFDIVTPDEDRTDPRNLYDRRES